MFTGTLSCKKSTSTGISGDNFGAAERRHIAGEIEVLRLQSCEVSNLHMQVAGEWCVPDCTTSRNKNLGKIIHRLRGCVYVVHYFKCRKVRKDDRRIWKYVDKCLWQRRWHKTTDRPFALTREDASRQYDGIIQNVGRNLVISLTRQTK